MVFRKSPFVDYLNDFVAGSAGVREAFRTSASGSVYNSIVNTHTGERT